MATEKRLFYANELLSAMCFYDEQQKTDMWETSEVENLLKELPTVEAVEVVRCKDCKHYMTIHCTCDGCCISDDWYCADGERRTGHV